MGGSAYPLGNLPSWASQRLLVQEAKHVLQGVVEHQDQLALWDLSQAPKYDLVDGLEAPKQKE